MTTTTIHIGRASVRDVETLSWLAAEAAEPLAISSWLVPDPKQRRRVLAAHTAVLLERALATGQVDTTPARDAVAVWLPHTGEPSPPPADYDRLLKRACGPYARRFRERDELIARHRPTEPHHVLTLLAVAAPVRGQGIGRLLLHRHHLRAAVLGLPTYVAARSRLACMFLAEHGYTLSGTPYGLGQNGAQFWPMRRPPAATGLLDSHGRSQ